MIECQFPGIMGTVLNTKIEEHIKFLLDTYCVICVGVVPPIY